MCLCARATLAANMETALNAVWDGGAGPGDRIVVVGAGVVGLLGRIPGRAAAGRRGDRGRHGRKPPPLVRGPGRRLCAAGARTGRCRRRLPLPAPPRAGLNTAINCAGLEAHHRRDELVRRASRCQVDLGGAFHSRRLKLVSSQVGHGLARPAAALGLSPPPARRRCACSPSRRWMRWWRRRSPSRMRPRALPRIFAPARTVLPQSSATRTPDTTWRHPCSPSRSVTGS